MKYITHSEQETKHVAGEFAAGLKGGDVVFLSGELGSGKTTFVRGVAAYFGFREPVRSPSFTIVNRYPIDHPQINHILHVDFYRINDPSEIPPLALEEELGRADTISVIEWPEKIREFMGEPSYLINFSVDGTTHTIDVTFQQHAGSPPRL